MNIYEYHATDPKFATDPKSVDCICNNLCYICNPHNLVTLTRAHELQTVCGCGGEGGTETSGADANPWPRLMRGLALAESYHSRAMYILPIRRHCELHVVELLPDVLCTAPTRWKPTPTFFFIAPSLPYPTLWHGP